MRLKCRDEDNIKKNVKETGYNGVNQVYLAQDRNRWSAVVNTAVNTVVL